MARDGRSHDVSVIDATITQLKAYCPMLAGNVAGAADFRLSLQNYNATLPLPAAYVVPLDQDSDGNQVMVGLIQVVTKRIGVVVEFDASPDRRGQDPAMSYDDMEAALFAAILNWRPEDCRTLNNQGYWFHGGRFLDLDRARLFYQWEFALNWQITDDDGWHDTGIPLQSIEVDIFKVPPQDMTTDTPPAVIVIDTADDTPIPQMEDA
jgi:hypothetical protein